VGVPVVESRTLSLLLRDVVMSWCAPSKVNPAASNRKPDVSSKTFRWEMAKLKECSVNPHLTFWEVLLTR
jgi:hypothetical protein